MDSLHLNWVDYIIVALVLLTTLSGFSRGLLREILSLLTLVAAYVVATLFAGTLSTSITNTDSVQHAMTQMSHSGGSAEPVSQLALGVSFTILFVTTVIIGSIICFIINYAFNKGTLGVGNRFLGGLFGIAKGLAISLALVFILQLTAMGDSSFWRESAIVKQMQPAVQAIGKQVSPSLNNLKEKFEKTMQTMTPAVNVAPSPDSMNSSSMESTVAAPTTVPSDTAPSEPAPVAPSAEPAPVAPSAEAPPVAPPAEPAPVATPSTEPAPVATPSTDAAPAAPTTDAAPSTDTTTTTTPAQ